MTKRQATRLAEIERRQPERRTVFLWAESSAEPLPADVDPDRDRVIRFVWADVEGIGDLVDMEAKR